MRNRKAILSKATNCIYEISFYHPLHAMIIRVAHGYHQGEGPERPPDREGNVWPMRPFDDDKRVFQWFDWKH